MILNRDGNYEPVITWLHKRTQKNTQIDFVFEDNTTFTCRVEIILYGTRNKKIQICK